MNYYPYNYDLYLKYQKCLYRVWQLQYITYQQYQQLNKIPPFAKLTDEELKKIQQCEKELGNKYYLIAFEKTVKNLMQRLKIQ
ncbi:hypothetical protein [Crassaminicella indica]|uniref:Uncharacterized protein n=1 Tax=Crassaminicella indica TaxID=2855394 RepID=A0ABX8RCR9_9CLOT|nr:hypothetical protein [Crassaminicella indica]QXM06854.1 hypothetical protein KVH43_03785 [Crassaminicella indica]